MIESIRCPNCGAIAERHHHAHLSVVKTQCEKCDYLLVMCHRSGRVLESSALGLAKYQSITFDLASTVII